IPVRKADLLDALIEHGPLASVAEREQFRRICQILAAIYHYETFSSAATPSGYPCRLRGKRWRVSTRHGAAFLRLRRHLAARLRAHEDHSGAPANNPTVDIAPPLSGAASTPPQP